jgi:SAM-dependent methyltransferase
MQHHRHHHADHADDADHAERGPHDLVVEDGAEDWDRRYARREQWWSGRPNDSLVTEVRHLDPGTALDVGCGEGADAVWLARRGWRVTALDISEVALGRARRAAVEAGVSIVGVRADLTADPVPGCRYDLVSVCYPALPHAPDDRALRAVIDAVAPGGTLLVVGHAQHGTDGPSHHGSGPAHHVQPADVLRRLGDGWTIEVDETRPRASPTGGGPDVPDVVLRARRT